ncbi:glycosyltransferase family 2 protein [Krasilnikovia cinnamomea]|uniref:glycosyltransferase family 2 protein n=1 Tax=Krasilnikovia cinnamomea TaxID=349313 RepID=UPI00102AD5B7|nr:glycosyltransferase family 2 protein [Krasilnikovia cinnamomea]
MPVSIVIPCFRSHGTLPELVARLDRVMPACADRHEIWLVVDDGEAATWQTASGLAATHPSVRAIRLSRNYGQHNALVAGLRAARHDVIVTMDDDLQHPPEQIPALLQALTGDVDLVYGVAAHEEHGALRSLASRTVKMAMARMLGVRHARQLSAFRAFRAHLIAGFDQIAGPHTSVDVALSWGTTSVAAVTVPMNQRANGKSGYTLRTLIRYTVNMLLGYSTLPLRLVTWIGLAVGAIGLALFARLAYLYFTGSTTVAGFTTIASAVAVFAAAQLIALGVLGEYVGRIHTAGMGRPTYLVRETAGADAATDPVIGLPEQPAGRMAAGAAGR